MSSADQTIAATHSARHRSQAESARRSLGCLAARVTDLLADPAVRAADTLDVMPRILLHEASSLLQAGIDHGCVSPKDIQALSMLLPPYTPGSRDYTPAIRLARQVASEIASLLETYVIKDYDHFSTVWNRKDSLSEVYYYSWAASILAQFMEGCRPTLPSHARVVDLGTGSGYPSYLLAARYPQYEFLATDISEAQLAHARSMPHLLRQHAAMASIPGIIKALLHSWGVSLTTAPRVRLIRSNMVPLQSSSVDACLMTTSILSYSPRTDEILADIHRVLTPGGRALLAFSYFSVPRLYLLVRTEGWRRALRHWRRGYHVSVIPVRTVPWSAKTTLNYKVSLSRARIHRALSLAGLRLRRTYSVLPLVYLWLAVKSAVRRDDPLPSAYTALRPRDGHTVPYWYYLLIAGDRLFARGEHFGYELWCEVSKDG